MVTRLFYVKFLEVMHLDQWIIAGVAFLTLLIVIIGLFSKNASRISVLESEHIMHKENIQRLDSDLKLHNAMNEKTFNNIDRELKDISAKLNQLIGLFDAKLK